MKIHQGQVWRRKSAPAKAWMVVEIRPVAPMETSDVVMALTTDRFETTVVDEAALRREWRLWLRRAGTCVQCRQLVELTPGFRLMPHSAVDHSTCHGSGSFSQDHIDGTFEMQPPIGLRETLQAIIDIAEGRRHYEDGGFGALGEIKDLAEKALEETQQETT